MVEEGFVQVTDEDIRNYIRLLFTTVTIHVNYEFGFNYKELSSANSLSFCEANSFS